MNGFVAALKAEIYVALRSNSTRLLVLLPALIVAVRALVIKLSETGQDARNALLGQNSFTDAAGTGTNAWGHFVDSFSIGLTLLSLILVAYAAFSFANDRDTGSLRHVLIRRTSRPALVLAKLATVHLLALCALLLMALSIGIITALLWEFGPVVEDGYELIGSAEIRTEVALGLRLALIPIPAALAFGVLVSVCAQSATQAVTSALGVTLALDIFKGVLGERANYLYATFQPSLIDQSYLKDVSRLVRGYSDVMIDSRMLQLNEWIPLPQMLLFVVLALIIVGVRKL
ncbi:MAG: ABC transporter permease subunit [Gammaproteobacteria bacterium]|nr:ABC transporter permease subunit [Gammaproteobacteria bacterium]MDP2141635.1 ABC transporter permease subunit [Gammaproteobacteria bacterium]MDP2346356.1 ABC transporter permease subunit [Gammaproteobacteria bacterium]